MSGEHENAPLDAPLDADELALVENVVDDKTARLEQVDWPKNDDDSLEHAQDVAPISEYRQVNVDKLIKMLFGMLGRVLGFGLSKVFGDAMLLDDDDADEISEIWN